MLRVVYRADDPGPGKLSDWREERGLIEFRVACGTKARQFIPSLNATLRDCVKNTQWFQVWGGEVISPDHPENPISVTFALSPFNPAPPVDFREHKGDVAVYLCPTATIDEIAPFLNRSVEECLAGGRWFQLWHGEIVTIDSPGTMAA
ncbi:hypothetical protein [Streptomyces acidicola]|uniref:Uncharacterized protein n=1 Tax=Streptomyces acidicola TaxID=2596892 RepID=A0A5N8WIX8_9ACTN|nr:hypothetical protein [Streptomyces acidicola]MPY47060.1 hypothetical protein [Streptomyces acidicola]MPY47199.1 hypothetical protein [Streptomyces acidicola]